MQGEGDGSAAITALSGDAEAQLHLEDGTVPTAPRDPAFNLPVPVTVHIDDELIDYSSDELSSYSAGAAAGGGAGAQEGGGGTGAQEGGGGTGAQEGGGGTGAQGAAGGTGAQEGGGGVGAPAGGGGAVVASDTSAVDDADIEMLELLAPPEATEADTARDAGGGGSAEFDRGAGEVE